MVPEDHQMVDMLEQKFIVRKIKYYMLESQALLEVNQVKGRAVED
tara:strand:- start:370 stop:504 length:135 start_codon:yes stop_codon:yes gene_type:complete